MKQTAILKIITTLTLATFTWGALANVPSNGLQVEYQKNSQQEIQTTASLNIDTIYHIPVATYHYLDNVFTSFYNKVIFNTDIKNSTFQDSTHYELVSIPFIAENEEGLQIELFGNFFDPSMQRLSNISADQALYNYYSSTEQWDLYDCSFSIGAGVSFNTGEQSKIKVLISSSEMPGYGTSNALLGFESKF